MSDYSYLVTDLVNAVEALTKENEDLRAKRVVEREALESRIVVYRAERDALRAQVSDLQVRYQDLWSEGRAVRDERRALQAQLDSMTKGGTGMSACQKCWSLASWKVQIVGGSVVDRYKEELARHPEHADEVIAEWARKEALLEAADIVHHHRFGKGQPLLSNSRLNQGVVDAECAIRALAEGEGQ